MLEAKTYEVNFSKDEKEILQEVMNISFGTVAAELAEVIDTLIVLSVPKVTIVSGKDFPNYLSNKLKLSPPFDIIEQSFSGKLKGHSLLIFPSGSEKKLVTMFGDQHDVAEEQISQLEKETLIEIGNILSGACVGRLLEQLNETVYFTLPRLIMATTPSWKTEQNLVDPDGIFILVKTEFKFASNDIDGYIFLITSQESFVWLKQALHGFMERF